MTELIVFKTDQPDFENQNQSLGQISNANKSARELFYENLENLDPQNAYHYQAFYDMETNLIRDTPIISDIPSITIKNIIRYCFVIVEDVSDINSNNVNQKKEYRLSIQSSFPISAIIKNKNVSTIIPADTPVNIIGVKILRNSYYDTTVPVMYNLQNNDIILSGRFGMLDKYTNQYYAWKLFMRFNGLDDVYIFQNEKDALEKINNIAKLIDTMLYFYNTTYVAGLFSLFIQSYNRQNTPKMVGALPLGGPSILDLLQIPRFNMFKSCFLYILDNFNASHINDTIQIFGENHPNTVNQIQLFNTQISNNQKHTIQNITIIKKELEILKKQIIAFRKFNIKDLRNLTKQQLITVELEYEKLEHMALISKTDELLYKVIKDLYYALEIDDIMLISKSMANLAKYIKIPNERDLLNMNDFIRLHGNAIICPHVIIQALKTIELKKNVNRGMIIRKYMINNYANNKPDDGYFCKIDGEKLADHDHEEYDVLSRLYGENVENDELKNRIWKNVVYIMTSFIIFKTPTNIRPIIDNIVATILPEINRIETDLIRVKTNSIDKIHDILTIHITIYTYAILIHIMALTEKMNFKVLYHANIAKKQSSIEGGRNDSAPSKKGFVQQKLQALLQHALSLIIKTQNIRMQNTLISLDTVKNQLITAYKWVLGLHVNIDTTVFKDQVRTPYFLSIDPIYGYLYQMALQIYYSEPKSKKDKPPQMTDVQLLLGQSIHDLEAQTKPGDGSIQKNLYNNVTLFEIPRQWQSINEKYKYGCYEFLITLIKPALYKKNIIPLGDSILLKEHADTYKYLFDIQEQIRRENKYKNIIPTVKYYWSHSNIFAKNQFMPQITTLSKIYCKSGNKHDFSILLYIMGGNKTGSLKNMITIDVKDFKSSGSAGVFWDKKCSKCGQLESEIGEDISMVIAEISKKDDFYKYYDIRCPISELHEFVDETCNKCGLTINDKNIQSDKYFNKYIKVFDKMYKEQNDIAKQVLKHGTTGPNNHDKNTIRKFPEWKITTSKILELATLVNKKYNVINNIGYSENVKYSQIETERKNPSSNATNASAIARNIKLKMYIMKIFREYYLLKNNTKIYDYGPSVFHTLLSETEAKGQDLSGKLTDIHNDFNEKYKYYESILSPIDMSNFLLNFISGVLLDINRHLQKIKFTKFAKILINYFINEIINTEKIMSIPNPLNTVIEKVKTIEFESFDLSPDDIAEHDDHIEPRPQQIMPKDIEDAPQNADDFLLDDVDVEIDDPEDDTLVKTEIF